jgi:PIN domain nuclease of toxin-antitoxin system
MGKSPKAPQITVNPLLLDTHYWLWLQGGVVDELPEEVRETLLLAQRRGTLYLSAISVLEAARLVAYSQLYLPVSIDQFVEDATRHGGLHLLPLTTHILIESTRLPGQIHRDPADRLLAATAREHGLTLVTRDKELLAYGRRGHLNALKL